MKGPHGAGVGQSLATNSQRNGKSLFFLRFALLSLSPPFSLFLLSPIKTAKNVYLNAKYMISESSEIKLCADILLTIIGYFSRQLISDHLCHCQQVFEELIRILTLVKINQLRGRRS